ARSVSLAAAVAWVALGGAAWAQVLPAPIAPGRVEQPLQPRPTVPPTGGAPAVPTIPGGEMPAGAETVHFALRGIQLSGVTMYPAGTFDSLYSNLVGKDVTLAQVYSVAQAMTARYRSDGYILSQAVLPAQQIANGVVQIRVVEGFVDKVIVKDELTGATGVDRSVLDRLAQKITTVRPLTAKALERYMLLINDLPGVQAKSFLAPSATTPGAADLTIVLNEKKYDGFVSFDNLGSRFVGPLEFSAAGNLDNALGIYERTGLRYAGTFDFTELKYIEASHQEQIGSEGMHVDFVYFHSDSQPDNTVHSAHLQVDSLNNTGMAVLTYPAIRSRAENLNLRARFDIDNIDVSTGHVETTMDRLRVLRLSSAYNIVDTAVGPPAVNLFTLEVSQGLPLLDASDKDKLSSNIRAPSTFTKVTLEVQRQQSIVDDWSLLLAGEGQFAATDLLSEEKIGLGGPLYGRGYDPSQIIGDEGLAGKVELQYGRELGLNWFKGYQAYAFFDAGYVHDLHKLVVQNHHLMTTGVGVRSNFTDQLSGFVQLAKQLTKSAAVPGTGESGEAWRVWGGAVLRF
ncbi:MAG TPA: ShlB/FhaC/HecB family hemolysin secretion/activation protein, partial [Caldimonas sp.]|nr:ShlB/FhaC/HecB family hemolysin secretion/activation protein [Caldimonas sp.]